MPSTPSSAEGAPGRSATEALASRYRHLFVLPATPTLLFCAATASAVLAYASRESGGAAFFLFGFVVFIFAAAVISSALLLSDRKAIADFRRTCAVLLAAEVLWVLLVVCGAAFGYAGAPQALPASFVFGAFVSAGFIFLVFRGVFIARGWLAAVLAAVYPAASLVAYRVPGLGVQSGAISALSGAMAFAAIAGFTVMLDRKKTRRGTSALELFRAFMKAWTAGDAEELERIIADHSEEAQIATRVLCFRTNKGKTFLVFPGVHPGPFHPVGSYDLPGVIARTFRPDGAVLTLHTPGGHERNLATSEETERYARGVRDFALSLSPMRASPHMKGPLHARIGAATACAVAFGSDMLLTVSFAPLGSDDLEADVESALSAQARPTGFDVAVVDAHNSLRDVQEKIDTSDRGWGELFERANDAEARPFRFSYASSAELGFGATGDLTEVGVSLVMFEAGGSKSALVLADANNAVPQLREEADEALRTMGYDLIELCTSDSHNLAARGLTVSRGYEALGEATPAETLVRLIGELAKLADGRLSECEYSSGTQTSAVRVFGDETLTEFAEITQSTSGLAKTYFRVAAVSIAALFVLAVLL